MTRFPLLTALLVLLLGGANASAYTSNEWTWSVPVPSLEGRRAYLWIDPRCPRVRGLVVACQNMLEQPLFDRPAFRQAAAQNGLGLLYVFSGHDKGMDDDNQQDHPARSYLDIFLNPKYPNGPEDPQAAGTDLQNALDRLAVESGHQEIRYAPLLPVGHSSAGSFVWHLYRWNPARIFAMMPFKTGAKDDGPEGIPIFEVNSEWFEYGNNPMHNCSLSSPQGGAAAPYARSKDAGVLYGYYVDIGSGHCDVSDDAIPYMALFLQKAVAARIPKNAPLDGPVALLPVDAKNGWALDPAKFGQPEGKPIPYAQWKGDPGKCFWYLAEELAAAVQHHVAAQLAKQPQYIGFVIDGHPPSPDARMASMSPKFEADGVTFRLQADYVDHIDEAEFTKGVPYYPPDVKLEHSSQPIQYRVTSGGVIQVGPDAFRVCPREGPVFPQGQPWEPTLVAYSQGDSRFRPTEHPIHINVAILNTEGQKQTLDFPKISDRSVGALTSVTLNAVASSGLPVQYLVSSGPATVHGDHLDFDPLPVVARFPLRVRVSAFQWGRSTGQKIQSAGPVTQEFYIRQ
jgi:hypothetical protein